MSDINSLPEDTIIEIFGNLSPKMIKTCSLVCKSWNEIIANSSNLMKNFQLNLTNSDVNIWIAKEIRRNHQSIIVKDLEHDSLDVISRHNLKSLNISDAEDIKISILIKALRNLPALSDFDARYAQIIHDIPIVAHLKKIRTNLKKLQCGLEIIHIFNCSSLRKFEVVTEESPNSNSKELLIDFLSKQKDLKELTLCDEFDGDLFDSDKIFKFKFSLMKLTLWKYTPFIYYDIFIRLLELQKNSLISLEVNFSTEPKSGIEIILKFVMEHLVNLKHLNFGHIDAELENSPFSFRDLITEKQVANNIESLVFYTPYDLDEAKRFFKMLPNLKRLNFRAVHSITVQDVHLLQHISCITKLESLSIISLRPNDLNYMQFPNLKEISVECWDKDFLPAFITQQLIEYWNEKYLCSFINRHSGTLEKISLPDAEIITEVVAKEILNCINFKSIQLFQQEISLRPMMPFRGISLKNSVTFTIKTGFEKKIFIFPDDKALWNEEIKSLR